MNEQSQLNDDRQMSLKPFTVSAIYGDGLESLIVHCLASDAQAARDYVLMKTLGAVIIASVFTGHLIEPDSVVCVVDERE